MQNIDFGINGDVAVLAFICSLILLLALGLHGLSIWIRRYRTRRRVVKILNKYLAK